MGAGRADSSVACQEQSTAHESTYAMMCMVVCHCCSHYWDWMGTSFADNGQCMLHAALFWTLIPSSLLAEGGVQYSPSCAVAETLQ